MREQAVVEVEAERRMRAEEVRDLRRVVQRKEEAVREEALRRAEEVAGLEHNLANLREEKEKMEAAHLQERKKVEANEADKRRKEEELLVIRWQ